MNKDFGQEDQPINYLEICCTKVALRLGKPNYVSWKNSDYVLLSSIIRKETKVHISENTLKRIFGKLRTTEQYTPQRATRDALAVFAGNRDWEELVLLETAQRKAASSKTIQPTPLNQSVQKRKKEKKLISTSLLFIGVVALIVVAMTYILLTNDTNSSLELYCKNPKGRSPHSAVFHIRNTAASSRTLKEYEVDFKSWKKSKTKLYDTLVSYYYELPGVYFPILLHKGNPVDTARVILNTNGWEITAQYQHDSLRVYPVPIGSTDFSNPPVIQTEKIYRSGIDTVRTFFVNYAWIDSFDTPADNMEFNVFLRASPNRPGVRCSQVDLTFYGETDNHHITLIKPQCTTWAFYKFSEHFKDGSEDDLRALGHDLTRGSQVKIRIENKNVSLYIDEKRVFTTRYERAIGNLQGINVMFSGVGEIKNPKVLSL